MQNILEYILFVSFSCLFRILGLTISRKFASVLTVIFYYLIPIRKQVTKENLKHAFPDYSDKKIDQIAYNSYKSFLITFVEILYLPWLTLEQIKKIISFENIQLIKQLYDKQNGVILMSGHFGNWEYIATSGAANLNLKFSVVVKPQRNQFVDRWMNKARTKWNNEVVPLGLSIRNIYSVLANKGIIAMVADQRGPEESIKLEFFGRKTSVYTGPAVLSIKTNAPIVYSLAVRQKDYSYKAKVTEISREDLPEDYDEKVKVLSERILRYLEDYIKEYPEQWLWMHRRWKH